MSMAWLGKEHIFAHDADRAVRSRFENHVVCGVEVLAPFDCKEGLVVQIRYGTSIINAERLSQHIYRDSDAFWIL